MTPNPNHRPEMRPLDTQSSTPEADPQRFAVDGHTFAIGILSVTACVLFVAFLVLSMAPMREATAANMNDRGGDYIMLTQSLTSSREACVVIDVASKQMLLYSFNVSKEELELVDRASLEGGAPSDDRRDRRDRRRNR